MSTLAATTITEENSTSQTREWVNMTQATKILGLTRDSIKEALYNAEIPFRIEGARYKFNIKLLRAFLARQDIENMKKIKKEKIRTPTTERRSNVRRVTIYKTD